MVIKRRKKAAVAWLLVLAMVLPMISSVIPAKATDTQVSAENNYDKMTMEQILSQEKSLTWVFAGDSITHNNTFTGGMNSYSEWFEQYLYDIGRGDDSVVLTAWGGADTRDFLPYDITPSGQGAKADPGMGLTKMITGYNPDVVFIKLGMNDRSKTTEEFRNLYNQILDNVYAAGEANGKRPKIVILTPTAISDENSYDDMAHPEQGENDAILGSTLRLRNKLEEIAKERKLLFCDLRTVFIKESKRLGEDYTRTYFSDGSDGGLHPNAAGQYLIFQTLSKALKIYDDTMPIFQLKPEDFSNQALYVDDTDGVTYTGEYGSVSGWNAAVTENYVWGVAGANQMSGYEGPVVSRSLFRYLDNAMRGGTDSKKTMRDIRMLNLASPAYENGVQDLLANFDKTMAIRDYDVFLLLPEIPDVYKEGYVHSEAQVAAYKAAVKELLDKNSGKVKILWTPLASGDEKINGYIDDYAKAVREIANADAAILFFDANQFMNDNMKEIPSLVNNWFEDGAYVSPLCSVDVARAFYALMEKAGIPMGRTLGIASEELSDHNLRYTSDQQIFKGKYIRDYVKADTSVDGTQVTVDISRIKAAYPQVANLRLAVMPGKGTGNYNANIRSLDEIAEVVVTGNVYTFEAPCADLHLAIYGEQDGLTYRFKDISLSIDTTATIPERKTAEPEGVYLDSLKVMSAPDFGFDKEKQEYTVNLYQYQTYARVRATAQAGLTIAVNGETVASNALSEPIKVEDGSKITVTVSNGAETKTYTLTCTKPENPDIIITEVMQDGYLDYTVKSGNDNYELIEIYNASGKELNLLDYSLGYKLDYTYNNVTISNGAEYPYYFTGNDQAFGGSATYTGVKPLAKYSIYWKDKAAESDRIPFPADSTMVIWLKTSPQGSEANRETYGAALTYDTLLEALKAHKGTKTLSVEVDGEERAVVPDISQLVVAEFPYDVQAKAISATTASRAQMLLENVNGNFLLANFSGYYSAKPPRAWLFILKDTAEPAKNGAITEAGDDIISAAKFSRAAKSVNGTVVGTDKLSSVFAYNYERGMSVVKNESQIDVDKIGTGNTSDVMGYSNLTSFGAIEYWQKPTDFGDVTAPVIVDHTNPNISKGSNAVINFELTDDEDVRYLELYVRKTGESDFTKVTKDFVLEAGVKNGGLSQDIESITYSYTVENVTDTAFYYAKVVDGNNNTAAIGSEEKPLTITTPFRIVQSYSAEEALTYVEKEAPECKSEGYVFAGWYADEACEEAPIRSAQQVTQAVHALFVSGAVMGVKAQLPAEVIPADTSAQKADMRFVTTVDTLRYKEVGFQFVIKGKETSRSTNTVYTKLYAINADKSIDELSPKQFSLASNYFSALTMTGIPASEWDTEIVVTPYWTTLDGTTVYGMAETKTVNQGRDKSVARIGDVSYNTFEAAVAAAVSGDTIEVLRDTTVDEMITIDKNLTITSKGKYTITGSESIRDAGKALLDVSNGAELTVNNLALSGGHDGIRSEGTLYLTNVDIIGSNRGLRLNKGSKTTVDGLVIEAKIAQGIAIYDAEATISNMKINGSDQAGVRIENSTVLIQNSSIENVKTWSVYVMKESTVEISDTVIKGSTESTETTIQTNDTSKLTLTNVTVERTVSSVKALVVVKDTSTVTMEGNSSIDGKKDEGLTGRGVEVQGTFILNGGKIVNNNVTSSASSTLVKANQTDGAGVYVVAGGTFTMSGGSMEGNTALNGAGGGVSLNGSGAVFTLNDSGTIKSNSAKFGGAVMVRVGTFTMNGGTLSGNNATSNGGAIYLKPGYTFTMDSGEITQNKAGQGGAIFVECSTSTVSAGTVTLNAGKIAGNTATTGKGIYCNSTAIAKQGSLNIKPEFVLTDGSVNMKITEVK